MAGLGFKTFNAGDVLTASDVNGYLMQQGVMTFASTTARDVAITAPTNGMITFQTDTNTMTQYRSGFWRGMGGATLSNSATLSASTSFTFSSIPNTFRNLEIILKATTANTSMGSITMTMNGLTTGIYHYANQSVTSASGTGTTAPASAWGIAQTGALMNGQPQTGEHIIRINDYAAGYPKTANWQMGWSYTNSGVAWGNVQFNSTASITSLTFAIGGTGGFTGTAQLFGVN